MGHDLLSLEFQEISIGSSAVSRKTQSNFGKYSNLGTSVRYSWIQGPRVTSWGGCFCLRQNAGQASKYTHVHLRRRRGPVQPSCPDGERED